MFDMSVIGEQTREFYRRQGEDRERARFMKLLDEQLCLDFKRDRSCDHGYCWCAFDLAKRLAVSDE